VVGLVVDGKMVVVAGTAVVVVAEMVVVVDGDSATAWFGL
jgi:hypothetical protein